MKIKKFSIRGFRSLKDVTWEPGDLNVLIGPNASGKSNLLRGLELFQEAAIGDLDDAIVRQGGIGPILWDSRASEVGWRVDLEPRSWYPRESAESFRYEVTLRPFPFGAGYRIEQEILGGHDRATDGTPGREFNYIQRDSKGAFLFDKKLDLGTGAGALDENKTVLSQTSKMMSNFEIGLFCMQLEGWRVYQDLTIHQDSPVRRAAVARRGTQLASNGENLVTVLHTLYTTEREFKILVNDAMRAAFGRDFEELEFPPAEDQRIQMRLRWRSLKVAQSAAYLSDGTLRFLMLVSILANPHPGDLIAIDEPETGLHPSMFLIVAELAAEASKTSQIIFTTHSPEFLTALGPYHPKTTIAQRIDGETRLSVLDSDDLVKWLKKYKLGEMFISGGLEALA